MASRSSAENGKIKLPTVRLSQDSSGEELCEALQTCGFAYLVDLEPSFSQAWATLLEASKSFFRHLTAAQRGLLSRGLWRAANAGYVGIGVEALAPDSGIRDPKEALNFVYGDRYEPLEALLPRSIIIAKMAFDRLIVGELVPLLVERLGKALERHGLGPSAVSFREAHSLTWPGYAVQSGWPTVTRVPTRSAFAPATPGIASCIPSESEHCHVLSGDCVSEEASNLLIERKETFSNPSGQAHKPPCRSEGFPNSFREDAYRETASGKALVSWLGNNGPEERDHSLSTLSAVERPNQAVSSKVNTDSSECFQGSMPGELATTLRLLHYPSIPLGLQITDRNTEKERTEEPIILAGAHSDYGTFTLLYQDGVGGLQLRINENWVDVERDPSDSSGLLLNVGDVLSAWTRGRIASTVHRVVARARHQTDEVRHSVHPDGCCTGDETYSAERFSVALFVHPLDHTVIDTATGLTAADILRDRLGSTYHRTGRSEESIR